MKRERQMRKRKSGVRSLLTLGLTLVLAVLLLCPVSAGAILHSSDFTDFSDMDGRTEEDYRAVAYVSGLGVMVGDEDGNFLPDKEVTRGEMAAILCRMMGQVEGLKPSERFVDVPMSYWANPYVNKVAELGAVKGYNEEKFGPEDPVTYEQAITMVIRAAGREDEAMAGGGYPNGFLTVADRAIPNVYNYNNTGPDRRNGAVFYEGGEQGGILSRADVAKILYLCMEYRICLPLMEYNLADCAVDKAWFTIDPSYANRRADTGARQASSNIFVQTSDGRIVGDVTLYSDNDYYDGEPDFCDGALVFGPVWLMNADNCPNGGSVIVAGTDSNGKNIYAKDANGETIHVLADDLDFHLNGEYATLEFDIGPLDYTPGNSLDDVSVYLDGNEAESFRILYGTAAQHCTLDVTGIQTVTIRVWGDPEYSNDVVGWPNTIAIFDSVLTK